MGKIVIRTSAFNASKTLRRAVDSVLNQTHQEFVYYLCDNGSTDNGETRRIVEEYAKQDHRIKSFYNEKNRVWDNNREFQYIYKYIDEKDYFCILDADDEYMPTFFEDMLFFLNEYNLDVCACGHDFIDAQTGTKLGMRVLEQNLILESSNDFSDHFPKYHQFMRTVWCKLYTAALLQRYTWVSNNAVAYGNDTLFAMEAFRHASRVGILPRTLHKYYVSDNSTSYQLNPKRITSDRILDDKTRSFLIDKCGMVSPHNNEFLYLVYFNAIKDTLYVLLNTQINVLEKLLGIKDIFMSKNTKQLILWPGLTEEKRQLYKSIIDWILLQKECRKRNAAIIAAEILEAIYPEIYMLTKKDSIAYLLMKIPDVIKNILCKDYDLAIGRLETWFKRHEKDDSLLLELELALYNALKKSDDEIFIVFLNIKHTCPVSAEKLGIDVKILELISKYPLIKNVSTGLALVLKNTIIWIMKNDYIKAIDDFIDVSQNAEISDDDIEAYLLLGQNLSAAANHVEAYIYFKKIWISYQLDCLHNEKAKQELDEFERLLPDDEDFAALRERLIQNRNEQE